MQSTIDLPYAPLTEEQSEVEHIHKTLLDKWLKKCGSSKHAEMTKAMFEDFVGGPTNFSERVFNLIDANKRGQVKFKDFCDFVKNFSKDNPSTKIVLLFSLYDEDGDGLLSKDEIKKMLRISMAENNLYLEVAMLEKLTNNLMDGVENEALTPVQFETLFEGYEELLENLSTPIQKWLETVTQSPKPKTCFVCCNKFRNWLMVNDIFLIWLTLFFVVNLILFGGRIFLFYKTSENLSATVYLALARGFGLCLDVDSCLILLTMMRNFLTFLRSTPLNLVTPIDDHILFHRIIGYSLVVFGMGHMSCHLGNVYVITVSQVQGQNWSYWEYLFYMEATKSLGLIPGFAYISGFILVTVLGGIVLLSTALVRRNGYFHVFYMSHATLYPTFMIIMVLHSRNFWKWIVIPGALFAVEQVMRVYKARLSYKTSLKNATILPSKVTSLVLHRPRNFSFSPGDYVFLNIPRISRTEWHPFTISSAPENWDDLVFHIRSVGPWTESLYNFFNYCNKHRLQISAPSCPTEPGQDDETSTGRLGPEPGSSRFCCTPKLFSRTCEESESDGSFCAEILNVIDELHNSVNSSDCGPHQEDIQLEILGPPFKSDSTNNSASTSVSNHAPMQSPSSSSSRQSQTHYPIVIYLDGPYGAPSNDIFFAEHAVMIAAGIGITPFSSVLQSIMFRHWSTKVNCPSCNQSFSHGFRSQVNKLKKLDFYWVNPDQEGFSWFLNVLSRLEIQQDELRGGLDTFLDIHMYMTKAHKGTDMKAIGLQLAFDLFYKKYNKDCLTQLKKRMLAGRPDWETIFQEINNNRRGEVSVYFCGPPKMGDELQQICAKYPFAFRDEKF